MVTSIPLTVRFTEPQLAWLKAEAAKFGVSIGDMVRRIVDDYRTAAAK
jgi:hypothetical protein